MYYVIKRNINIVCDQGYDTIIHIGLWIVYFNNKIMKSIKLINKNLVKNKWFNRRVIQKINHLNMI